MRSGENAGCIILFIRVLQPAFSSKNVRIRKKRRKLTLLGKINIVKSVGLSKLNFYNASVLPVPKNLCDQGKQSHFNFIWDNKVAKIKKKKGGGGNYWRTQIRGVRYGSFYVNEQSLKAHLDKAISPER